jgi:hypothetical protein
VDTHAQTASDTQIYWIDKKVNGQVICNIFVQLKNETYAAIIYKALVDIYYIL